MAKVEKRPRPCRGWPTCDDPAEQDRMVADDPIEDRQALGSADTLDTAATVSPCGRPASSSVVTTVTVAGAVPMMSK